MTRSPLRTGSDSDPPHKGIGSTRPAPIRWACALFGLLLMAGPTGCGYSTAELYPDRYQTVSLPLFENRTFYRGVEADLGEALAKELEQRSPYKIVGPTAADTELTGTIQRIEQRMLSRTAQAGLPQELEVSVWIDFAWTDLRTGEVITDRRGYEQVGRYIPAAGVGEPFEVAQHAAVQRLAKDVVSALRGGW